MKTMVLLFLALLIGCGEPELSGPEYFKKGKELFNKGEYHAAALELKNAIQKQPELAETHYYLALIHEKNQQYKAMLLNLQDAVQRKNDFIEARLKLAKVQQLFGQIDEAMQQVDAVLKLEPDNLEAKTIKAQILEKQNKEREAFALLEEVLKKEPGFVDALALKAAILIKNKDFQQALALVDQGLKNNQDKIVFHLLKVKVHNAQNNFDALIQDYNTLAAMQPDNEAVQLALANTYKKMGDFSNAEKVLRTLVNNKPKNFKAKISLLELLAKRDKTQAFEQLENFWQQSDEREKLELIKWALLKGDAVWGEKKLQELIADAEDKKTKNQAQFLLASMRFQQQAYDDSEELIQDILAESPNFTDAKVLRAAILIAQNKKNEATELLNNILWESPGNDKALVLLAKMNDEQGERNKAYSQYQEALKNNPANLQALLPVVNREISRGHHEYARELLKKALTKGGQQLRLLILLAKLDIADKKWDSAEEIIGVIENNENGKVVGQLLKGMLLSKQQKYDQAIDIYKNILERYPGQNSALQALASVYEKKNARADMMRFLNDYSAKHPQQIMPFILQSRLLVLEGKQSEAIDLLNKIRHNNPAAVIYHQLAVLYSKQGKLDLAEDIIKQGLVENPGNIRLLMDLASNEESKKETDKAIGIYQKILAAVPNYDIAKNNLAALLVEKKDSQSIKKALDLTKIFRQSEHPYFLDTYAWVQFKAGNIDEAYKIQKKIVVMAPDIPVFRFHLAQMELGRKNRAAAISELREALQLSKKSRFDEENQARVILEKLVKK